MWQQGALYPGWARACHSCDHMVAAAMHAAMHGNAKQSCAVCSRVSCDAPVQVLQMQ